MKYIFLKKNENAEESIRQKYAYNYYYYVTTIDDYIYNEKDLKDEINFGIEQVKEDNLFKITDFCQSYSNSLQNDFGKIFGYILSRNIIDKEFIKFTVNDDDKNDIKIENVEF